MADLLHELISVAAHNQPAQPALVHNDNVFSYAEVWQRIRSVSNGLIHSGLMAGDRVAINLPKLPEAVFGMFGAALSGNIFVPINPLLKHRQVAHILQDCQAKLLITSRSRWSLLAPALDACTALKNVVLIEDDRPTDHESAPYQLITWRDWTHCADAPPHRRIDIDPTAILYTSGSTGQPKGVVLSHKNMVSGASSVSSYLHNNAEDRILAVLPFSFDYGLSQLTTAFYSRASVILMEYLLPGDVVKAVTKHRVTGLAAVPPLWNQLADLQWPPTAVESLRYLTNSGGAMPQSTTRKLRAALPKTSIFLMYGLTESFRSTYLDPAQLDHRPDSIGKAIPNADVSVVREDGSECDSNEPGELVHRGDLVALGYWNDPEKTATRFKPSPGQCSELPITEIAVWSGDQVRRDEEGYLYFVGRKDELIKTSGYRVSPTEIEEVLFESALIENAAVVGVPHPALGEAIVAIVTLADQAGEDQVITHCRAILPNYMVPQRIVVMAEMPRNQNGKIDRNHLKSIHKSLFQQAGDE